MGNCLSLTSSICRGCRDSAGGIKKIYAANACSVDTITRDQDNTVTGITLAAGSNWYELVPNKNTSNWVENINASIENGTLYYEQVVTAVFGKNTQALRNTIDELNQSELVLVVEDNNGIYWLIGQKDNGAVVTGGSSASGTAYADLNGWNVTMTCNSVSPADTVGLQGVQAITTGLQSVCGC